MQFMADWVHTLTRTKQEVCLWVRLNVMGTSVFYPHLEGQMSLQSKIQGF